VIQKQANFVIRIFRQLSEQKIKEMFKAIGKRKKKISARLPEIRMKPETGKKFCRIFLEFFMIF